MAGRHRSIVAAIRARHPVGHPGHRSHVRA
jgi:hypothetical protein